MDFNEPPRGDGPCQNRNCSGLMRRKRRRIYEPDDDNSEQLECGCGRPLVTGLALPVEESSGDEQFSDEGEMDNTVAIGVVPANDSTLIPNYDPNAAGPSTSAGPSSVGPIPTPVFVPLPMTPSTSSSMSAVPLQSPRTPGSGTSIGSVSSRVEDFCWQESRPTLSKRAEYLLNNARMSDVRFLVGESKTEIYAHKTLLALGSPVFEAQFFGCVGSGPVDVIELPDMDAEIFLMFLKYLYTDELEPSLDDSQLLGLLRPAKKYIVPHLVDRCSDILMTELKPENIFQILHHAQFYQLRKLEGACERYIDRHSEAIVRSDEFTNLEISILTEFLKRDGLNIKEETLFQAVLRWATAECQRNSVVPNFENLRSALGECLKLIRFPTMGKEEFASVFETTTILSPEEACSVFVYMCKSTPAPSAATLIFPTVKRNFAPKLCVVSRFSGPPVDHCLNYRSGEIYNYRINFKVDRPIYLKGVNIFSIRCGLHSGVVYSGNRRDFSGALYLYEKGTPSYLGRKQFNKHGSLEAESEEITVTLIGSERRQFYPVLFNEEIPIASAKTYTLCVVVSVNSHSYPSQPLQTFVGTTERSKATVLYSEDLPLNFTFTSSSGNDSVGKFTSAQIPELVFCL